MVDVIYLSSDDSDVEFVSCSTAVKPPPPPPPPARTCGGNDVVDQFDNHKTPRRHFSQVPDLSGLNQGQYMTEEEQTSGPVTPSYVYTGTNNLRTETSGKHGNLISSADSSVLISQQDCGNTETNPGTSSHKYDHIPIIKQVPCHDRQVTELESSLCSINMTEPDLHTESVGNRKTSTDSEYTGRNTDHFSEPHQQTCISIDGVHEKPNHTLYHSTVSSFSPRTSPSGTFDSEHLTCRDFPSYHPECKFNPSSRSDVIQAGNKFDCHSEDFNVEGAGDDSESVFKSKVMDEALENGEYRGTDSPLFVDAMVWPEEGEEDENKFDDRYRAASQEDRNFVCPLALKKITSGPSSSLNGFEATTSAKVLCRQSLGLVYITIDENYTEGTLQILSNLIQPGYYPPKDITNHLLRNILLQPQCPHHLRVQAFGLLMRSQRHHGVDETMVPWDWNLLTTVMANQNDREPSVIGMFLDFIVQTLEDDLQAKRIDSTLNQSIAKSLLSCDQQFSQVRDVISWLFSAIMKSGESREGSKESNEQIRIVCSLQRMLSLALEVDQSPALSSDKLSQELFHMLISNHTPRAQRMLLLESLQSTRLRWKLLLLLLDYSCPMRTTLPMSLSLLLHFMKNCILSPDSMDGAEQWMKWEELVNYLWMLLLAYKAQRGPHCSTASDQRDRSSSVVFRSEEKLSKPDIHEAVNSFLSRSKDDIGQGLPFHVEDSLMYLQDYLLEVSQCQSEDS